jgi:hypothetical protein
MERLRKTALGDLNVPPFAANDWRPNTLALLLWDAAESLDALRKIKEL